MINETDYTILLKYNYISQQFTKYIGIILYTLCLFGTVMNILTFMQQVYKSRACSLYLLIASICDLIHLNFGPLSNILQDGFHYDWTINSIIYCKIKSYFVYVFNIISASFTTLASIDRYMISSRKTKRWKFSTRSIAMRCILFIIIFWFIISIPIAFCYTRPNHSLYCLNPSKHILCFLIEIFYICIFNGFIPPIAIIYFSFRTCINARLLRHRSLSNSVRIQQINYQLTLMFILQSIKSSLTSLPLSIFKCYLLITLNVQKSPLRQAKENFIHQIFYILFWSNYTSFFVYIYSSNIFRHQYITTIKKIVCCYHRNKRKHYSDQIELKNLTTSANTFNGKSKPSQML